MNKVLIIVDVQNDFCPGGSLAVEKGSEIIPVINRLGSGGYFDAVIATQDWHPENHMSYAEKYGAEPFTFNDEAGQIVWPVHCVQGTEGAELHPELDIKPVRFIVRKGMNPGIDSYSAFLENDKNTQTGLFSLLEKAKEVYVCGIALDVCVFNTAMDALKGGFRSVTVITDASAAVTEEGGKKACAEMENAGIRLLESSSLPGKS